MTSNTHIQHCPNPNPYLPTEQYYILIMISHFIQVLIITTSCQDESAIFLVVVYEGVLIFTQERVLESLRVERPGKASLYQSPHPPPGCTCNGAIHMDLKCQPDLSWKCLHTVSGTQTTKSFILCVFWGCTAVNG